MTGKNIQRLIKQTLPFHSEYIKAEIGFLYVTNHLNSQFQELLKSYEITQQQYNVLRILKGQNPNPANINLIRERMLDKMSDASRIVDRLLKLGYVRKQNNEIDKRNTDVYITDKALALLSSLDSIVNNRKNILRNLSQTDITTLNALIDKMLETVE